MTTVFQGMRWLDELRRRKQVRKARFYRLRDLPEHTLARVTGAAQAFDRPPLTAPLSGRACVYYAVEVYEIRTGWATSHQGIAGNYLTGMQSLGPRMAKEQAAIEFVLVDGDERAVVDARVAEIKVLR